MKKGWVAEQRVTRGPGDHDEEMPQPIAEGYARFVWACFDTDNRRRWCGARHATAAIAKDHAGILNSGIRGETK